MKKIIVIPLAMFAFMPGLFAQSSTTAETVKTAEPVQIEASIGPVTVTSSQPAFPLNASVYKVNIGELDTNGDGELSRREIPASHALTHEFHLVDINHNGFITEAELEKANGR